jgi:small subunit ribosomal protein S5
MGLVSESTKQSVQGFRPYDDKEKAALSKMYTPQQLRVIEEAEAAIDPKDLAQQGRFRTDPYMLPYLDDLSVIRPVIDSRIKEESTIPENARWMNETERVNEVSQWLAKEHSEYLQNKATNPDAPFKPSRLDFMKFFEESTSMTGGGKRGSTVLAPALPKIPSMKGQYTTKEGSDPRDPDGKWLRLQKQTGLNLDAILEIKKKVLVNNFVTNQTRLGKVQRLYCLAVAGDGKGRLGIGEGKAMEGEDARHKAVQAAIRNMRPIPRYEDRTIYGEVEGKVAACEVRLMSRPPGSSAALWLVFFSNRSRIWSPVSAQYF